MTAPARHVQIRVHHHIDVYTDISRNKFKDEQAVLLPKVVNGLFESMVQLELHGIKHTTLSTGLVL